MEISHLTLGPFEQRGVAAQAGVVLLGGRGLRGNMEKAGGQGGDG